AATTSCRALPGRCAANSRRRTGRQPQVEPAAGAEFALELDLAAECDSELAGDRQSEPGSTAVPRPEGAEDPLPVGRLDPRTGVRDRDGNRPVVVRERELDPSAVRRPPKGVGEEVGDDLEDPVSVGDDDRRAVAVAAVVDLPPPRLLAERGIR